MSASTASRTTASRLVGFGVLVSGNSYFDFPLTHNNLVPSNVKYFSLDPGGVLPGEVSSVAVEPRRGTEEQVSGKLALPLTRSIEE